MANLFIIGNGFDLAHQMETKAEHFHKYLQDKYPSADEWSLLVPESSIGVHEDDLQYDDDIVGFLMYLLNIASSNTSDSDNDEWHDIEGYLGQINLAECFDIITPQFDKDGDRDFLWERNWAELMCGDIACALPRISNYFADWIHEIEVSERRLPKFMELINPSDDLYLTFNYTRTLECLYSCKYENICHIHGAVHKDILQSNDLILGHCGSIDYEHDVNVPYGMGCSLQMIYDGLRKDTARQILLHRDFFDKLVATKIEAIYSHGFSFSQVDLPYIEELCKCIDTSRIVWYLNDHDIPKYQQYKKVIRNSGFKGTFSTYSVY